MIDTVPTVEEAYALYGARVLSICMRMLRNQEDAEDARQEVFLRLHKRMHQFNQDSQFYTWLHRIAINVALEKLRSNRSRKFSHIVSLEQMQEDREEGVRSDMLDQALLVEDPHLNITPERLSILVALKNMPEGYRMSLELHDIQGFSHEEIAAVLGTTVATSKSQSHRAKRWLAREMGIKLEAEPEIELKLDFTDFSKWMEKEA